MGATTDLAVIGGGVIGLGAAWRCAQRGLDVMVLDPAPGSGASWTAAGMLAPVTELHYGEHPLLALNLDSLHRYPGFVAELESATGRSVGYRETGTVVAAWDGADLAALRDLAAYADSLGHPTETLTGRGLHRLVPLLAGGLPGGLLAIGDHHVDNRLLHAALLAAVAASGGHVVREPVAEVVIEGERAMGVRLGDGTRVAAGSTLLAAGAWSRQLAGLPDDVLPPVRPVKGQTLRLRLPEGERLERIVRGTVKGSPVYVVPRADGQLVVGASSEETGFDVTARAGAVYELLRDAQSLLPILGEAEFVEVSTGLRPGSPDNAPIIGRTAIDDLLVATGHYRNGVLLTPVTADGVAAVIVDGALPDVLASFTPQRFTRRSSPREAAV